MNQGLFKTAPRRFSFLLALCASFSVYAADPVGLPQPLTLEYALSLVDEEHPSIQQARADQLAAQARQQITEAADDVTVSLEARARWVQPPASSGDSVMDDHKGSLFVRKSLYDFGRSSSLQQAARSEAQAMVVRYQSKRDQRRLAIMRAYFDVLLADQENFRDNEALATSFIAVDRKRTRQELGQASDIEVLKLESAYQRVRNRLLGSESRQRLGRSALASLLNRPGELPSDLVTPSFNFKGRPLPDYERLLGLAEKNNSTLQAIELDLRASEGRISAVRSGRLPTLNGELEASTYSRTMGSSDSWRAGVTLSVPIYNGGRIDAAMAMEQAELMRVRAQLSQVRQELRHALLESWFEIQRLARRREQALSELDYRELYLDRSRANYEMEVKADLGDAMVRLSDAQIELVKNDFDTALAWEQLRSLLGTELNILDQAVKPAQGSKS